MYERTTTPTIDIHNFTYRDPLSLPFVIFPYLLSIQLYIWHPPADLFPPSRPRLVPHSLQQRLARHLPNDYGGRAHSTVFFSSFSVVSLRPPTNRSSTPFHPNRPAPIMQLLATFADHPPVVLLRMEHLLPTVRIFFFPLPPSLNPHRPHPRRLQSRSKKRPHPLPTKAFPILLSHPHDPIATAETFKPRFSFHCRDVFSQLEMISTSIAFFFSFLKLTSSPALPHDHSFCHNQPHGSLALPIRRTYYRHLPASSAYTTVFHRVFFSFRFVLLSFFQRFPIRSPFGSLFFGGRLVGSPDRTFIPLVFWAYDMPWSFVGRESLSSGRRLFPFFRGRSGYQSFSSGARLLRAFSYCCRAFRVDVFTFLLGLLGTRRGLISALLFRRSRFGFASFYLVRCC